MVVPSFFLFFNRSRDSLSRASYRSRKRPRAWILKILCNAAKRFFDANDEHLREHRTLKMKETSFEHQRCDRSTIGSTCGHDFAKDSRRTVEFSRNDGSVTRGTIRAAFSRVECRDSPCQSNGERNVEILAALEIKLDRVSFVSFLSFFHHQDPW